MLHGEDVDRASTSTAAHEHPAAERLELGCDHRRADCIRFCFLGHYGGESEKKRLPKNEVGSVLSTRSGSDSAEPHKKKNLACGTRKREAALPIDAHVNFHSLLRPDEVDADVQQQERPHRRENDPL